MKRRNLFEICQVRREKANSHGRVTVDEEVSNGDDIQGSEETSSSKQLRSATLEVKVNLSRVAPGETSRYERLPR
jgi:hypothetical protein